MQVQKQAHRKKTSYVPITFRGLHLLGITLRC